MSQKLKKSAGSPLKQSSGGVELDGSPNGSRSRIRFSQEQLEQLENHFREENYPSKDRRTEIAETLQLAPDKVYSWFNNRRVKFRRDEGETNGAGAGSGSSDEKKKASRKSEKSSQDRRRTKRVDSPGVKSRLGLQSSAGASDLSSTNSSDNEGFNDTEDGDNDEVDNRADSEEEQDIEADSPRDSDDKQNDKSLPSSPSFFSSCPSPPSSAVSSKAQTTTNKLSRSNPPKSGATSPKPKSTSGGTVIPSPLSVSVDSSDQRPPPPPPPSSKSPLKVSSGSSAPQSPKPRGRKKANTVTSPSPSPQTTDVPDTLNSPTQHLSLSAIFRLVSSPAAGSKLPAKRARTPTPQEQTKRPLKRSRNEMETEDIIHVNVDPSTPVPHPHSDLDSDRDHDAPEQKAQPSQTPVSSSIPVLSSVVPVSQQKETTKKTSTSSLAIPRHPQPISSKPETLPVPSSALAPVLPPPPKMPALFADPSSSDKKPSETKTPQVPLFARPSAIDQVPPPSSSVVTVIDDHDDEDDDETEYDDEEEEDDAKVTGKQVKKTLEDSADADESDEFSADDKDEGKMEDDPDSDASSEDEQKAAQEEEQSGEEGEEEEEENEPERAEEQEDDDEDAEEDEGEDEDDGDGDGDGEEPFQPMEDEDEEETTQQEDIDNGPQRLEDLMEEKLADVVGDSYYKQPDPFQTSNQLQYHHQTQRDRSSHSKRGSSSSSHIRRDKKGAFAKATSPPENQRAHGRSKQHTSGRGSKVHGSKGHGSKGHGKSSSLNDYGHGSSGNVKSYSSSSDRYGSSSFSHSHSLDSEYDHFDMSDDDDSNDLEQVHNPFEPTLILSQVEDLCRTLVSDIPSRGPLAFDAFHSSLHQMIWDLSKELLSPQTEPALIFEALKTLTKAFLDQFPWNMGVMESPEKNRVAESRPIEIVLWPAWQRMVLRLYAELVRPIADVVEGEQMTSSQVITALSSPILEAEYKSVETGLHEALGFVAHSDVFGHFPTFSESSIIDQFSPTSSEHDQIAVFKSVHPTLLQQLNSMFAKQLEREVADNDRSVGLYFGRSVQRMKMVQKESDQVLVLETTLEKLQSDMDFRIVCQYGLYDPIAESQACASFCADVVRLQWSAKLLAFLSQATGSCFHLRLLWIHFLSVSSSSPLPLSSTSPDQKAVWEVAVESSLKQLAGSVGGLVQSVSARFFFYEGSLEDWRQALDLSDSLRLNDLLDLLSRTFRPSDSPLSLPTKASDSNAPLSEGSSQGEAPKGNGHLSTDQTAKETVNSTSTSESTAPKETEQRQDQMPLEDSNMLMWKGKLWYLEIEDPRNYASGPEEVKQIERLYLQKHNRIWLQNLQIVPDGFLDFLTDHQPETKTLHQMSTEFSSFPISSILLSSSATQKQLQCLTGSRFFGAIVGWFFVLLTALRSSSSSSATSRSPNEITSQLVQHVETWRLSLLSQLLKQRLLLTILVSQQLIERYKVQEDTKCTEWAKLVNLFGAISSKISLQIVKHNKINFVPSNLEDCSHFAKFLLPHVVEHAQQIGLSL